MNSKYDIDYIRAIVSQKGPLHQFQNKYPSSNSGDLGFRLGIGDAQLAIEQTIAYLASYISKRPQLELTDRYVLNLFFQAFWQKIEKMYKIKKRKNLGSMISEIELNLFGPNSTSVESEEKSELDELRYKLELGELRSIEAYIDKAKSKLGNITVDQSEALNRLKTTDLSSYLALITCLSSPNADRNFQILMDQNMDFEFYILINDLNQRLMKETLYGVSGQIRELADLSEIAKLRKVTTAQLLAQINRFS